MTSMVEFRTCFGEAPRPQFTIADDVPAPSGIRFRDKNYVVKRSDRFNLYCDMQLFYADGSSPCCVVSVGSYSDDPEKAEQEAGITPLLKEQESTMVGSTKSVREAPADTSIAMVVSPAVDISHDGQEELSVPLSGKSVNTIRTFTGESTKVWDARTPDGNSFDWRYVNVRRTMVMLEEPIKNAAWRIYI